MVGARAHRLARSLRAISSPPTFKTEIAEGEDIRPTIAVTRARLDLIEMRDAIRAGRLKPDGKHVLENGSLSVVKVAIDPVWHLPGVAERFGTTETDLRRALFEQTAGMFPELVTRPDMHVFLPPIGGITVYLFGDVEKLANPRTKITCRVHDECNGSDVFGSDICTCRPYLVHGIEECARSAQAGGLGVIVYNRKEGRALGEVTKFLVYNARKRQEGGDQAATYFERTECVAGVQDARFQQLMPDPIHWLGLRRIDRFVSMSDMKHDALVSQGIEIVERVPIPDDLVPPDAHVEIDAKRAAGYYSPEPTKPEDPDGSGRPPARANIDGRPWIPDTAGRAVAPVRRRGARAGAPHAGSGPRRSAGAFSRRSATGSRTPPTSPSRSRAPPIRRSTFRFIRAGGISCSTATTAGRRSPAGATGQTRPRGRARNSISPSSACCSMPVPVRTGAIATPRTGREIGRSEGLALASLAMFGDGLFSAQSPRSAAGRCGDTRGTRQMRRSSTASRPAPPIRCSASPGRADLLRRLGRAVAAAPAVFGRAGRAAAGRTVRSSRRRSRPRGALRPPPSWRKLLKHLGPIWPARIMLGGIPLGDCWRHPAIAAGDATDGLMPLHKLSQWLTYSLIEPMERAGIAVTDIDGLTGLAEYRNGGLFIDTGALAFRDPADARRAHHDVDSTLVVEWRALTVALLDRLAGLVRQRLGRDAQALAAAQDPARRHLGGGARHRAGGCARTARRRCA